MNETELKKYLAEQNLASNTQTNCLNALRRIERAYSIDLDNEFARDQLADLALRLSYSKDDARSGRPNPTPLSVDQDKLYSHLAWYRSHLNTYRRFRGAQPAMTDASDILALSDAADAIDQVFGLERNLQIALRRNIEQLEPGLTITDGGNERRVEGGLIDICARDKHGVDTIVELKVETARPAAVAQILAYMGCVAQESGAPVRGILVAADFDKRVELAVSAVPNLTLKRYRFKFEFL